MTIITGHGKLFMKNKKPLRYKLWAACFRSKKKREEVPSRNGPMKIFLDIVTHKLHFFKLKHNFVLIII